MKSKFPTMHIIGQALDSLGDVSKPFVTTATMTSERYLNDCVKKILIHFINNRNPQKLNLHTSKIIIPPPVAVSWQILGLAKDVCTNCFRTIEHGISVSARSTGNKFNNTNPMNKYSTGGGGFQFHSSSSSRCDNAIPRMTSSGTTTSSTIVFHVGGMMKRQKFRVFHKSFKIEAITISNDLLLVSLDSDHIASYIDFKKILIGIVNGPAVGLGVTSLPFFDAVFATERAPVVTPPGGGACDLLNIVQGAQGVEATFNTPFTALGQTPEACSSFFLPRIMGYAKATQMLLFGTKITAREAEQCGLITEIFPDDVLKSNAWDRIHKMAELPINALLHAKELLRGRDRDLLHHVNKTEMVRMKERVNSEDCMDAVLKFFARKTKK
ncbi:Enoyl-CoA delta isomerase 2, mitochondrial [Folsomia candida]|uniref:Enoyl-CoA delta isomerase 2, mitochondrial n=1 Tax=Folsomia candida TaxID=158441 RepID=A0A226DN75_FOLCA|nr:Enoyl-CoA delta isomerase 2, mitochondrial [Folsomia candida]